MLLDKDRLHLLQFWLKIFATLALHGIAVTCFSDFFVWSALRFRASADTFRRLWARQAHRSLIRPFSAPSKATCSEDQCHCASVASVQVFW